MGRFFDDIMAAELPSLAGRTPFAGPLGEVLAKWKIPHRRPRCCRCGTTSTSTRGSWRPSRNCGPVGSAALATNQHPERAAYMRESLGYDEVFDDLFYSCELGVAKPDPAYFAEAARRLGTEPGRTLLLDDNADNVAGAKAGLVAELFASDGGRAELDRILGAYAGK